MLKRSYPRIELFKIGEALNLAYFNSFTSEWEIDDEEASFEIAANLNDKQLKKIFENRTPREWAIFRGQYYTLEKGSLRLRGSWERLRTSIQRVKKRYGKDGIAVLRTLAKINKSCSLGEIKKNLKNDVDPYPILVGLERLKVIVTAYKGDGYQEWKILEETSPLIRSELGLAQAPILKTLETSPLISTPTKGEKPDHLWMEHQKVAEMDRELGEYLNVLLKRRLDATVKFGKTFSLASLADYLQNLFGSILYFDNLLSIVQQYGLTNTEITHPQGKTSIRTGWSLALFGEPGTGKSFATRNMILGRHDANIPPHGIPGRNRYCGGMSPARFIRMGQAYVKRTFNFVVPEFNDWFKYSGMVDVLKLAMEQGEIKYELHREVIGPYRFESFLSVNYNTAVSERGYEVTVSDPNFNAIEDRMVCRLHRLTKRRFVEIAQSQMRLALGEIEIGRGAKKIRDHATLVYAIETGHPLVRRRFPYKPVMITPQAYDTIKVAREAILEQIPREVVRFSARLEDRAIRFACAASLLNYFHSDLDYIPVSEDALKYAIQLYVEEASVRSQEELNPEEILKKLQAA